MPVQSRRACLPGRLPLTVSPGLLPQAMGIQIGVDFPQQFAMAVNKGQHFGGTISQLAVIGHPLIIGCFLLPLVFSAEGAA